MARTTKKLSALEISRLKLPGFYHTGDGLYLRISKAGATSWIYRYMLSGHQHDMGVGPYPSFSLAEARAKLVELRKLKHNGIDPIDARAGERLRSKLHDAKAITFQNAATRYIEAHTPSWRNKKHAAQWTRTLELYAFPHFGGLPVQQIDTPLVLRAIQPIWVSKTQTASRVRQRIEAILDWAKVSGYRDGENPARWRGHLDHALPAQGKVRRVENFSALPYLQIGSFVADLRKRDEVSSRALEFLILTACRTGEALGCRWSEIDLSKATWTVPGTRIKAGRDHVVPLSKPALAILSGLNGHTSGDIVFESEMTGRALSNNALLALLKRMGSTDITVHGFRSTFSEWAHENTGHSSEAIEMSLAHVKGDKVAAAYHRGDLFMKRKVLIDEWARHCAVAQPSGTVVEFDVALKEMP